MVKNQEDYHWFCDTWKLNDSQLSVHQQRLTGAQPAHLLPSCVWLLWYCVSRAEESPQRLYGLQRVKYLLSGHWQKKCADPCCSYKKKSVKWSTAVCLHISLLDNCYNLKIKNCFIGIIWLLHSHLVLPNHCLILTLNNWPSVIFAFLLFYSFLFMLAVFLDLFLWTFYFHMIVNEPVFLTFCQSHQHLTQHMAFDFALCAEQVTFSKPVIGFLGVYWS